MSGIKYRCTHHLPLEGAKKIAHEAADDLGREYNLVSEREGDTLHFHRSGVDGHMRVITTHIDLNVKLGFLLRPFKSAFEHHIENNLDKLLAKGDGTSVAKADKAAKRSTRKT
jgi:putative polyhydroxyalkanoate system protein